MTRGEETETETDRKIKKLCFSVCGGETLTLNEKKFTDGKHKISDDESADFSLSLLKEQTLHQ